MARLVAVRFTAFLTCLALMFFGSYARAGWHHHYRACSSCGSSCGSTGGSCGHHRCFRCRHHASHGSSGGSSGGSTGGSTGGSSGGAAKTADAGKDSKDKDASKDTKKAAAVGVPADGLVLVVEVPEDATLLVNGRETALSGSVRNFVSAGLSEEESYDYEVTMRVDRGGKVVEKTRTVTVSGGQRHAIAFDAPAESVQTLVTLHVPAEARVWIEGQATTKQGAIREFRTQALAHGESWEGYEVKVAVTIDGRQIEAVKRVDLVGGRDLDLSIDPVALLAEGAAESIPAANDAPVDATAAVVFSSLDSAN